MRRTKLGLAFVGSVLVVWSGFVGTCAEANSNQVFNLSLEDLLNTEVIIGNVTGSKLSLAPVCITTITREMIAITPARNIADLIEIYVPGALWLDHLAPRIGIRGLVADRNYKILLLVNGRNMNQKASQGITLELLNWDLNDIERIEVIRGPGSVTYGPGAIAGVINIITRSASTAPGTEVGVEHVTRYTSTGGYGSYGYTAPGHSLYLYGSARRTEGLDNPRFFEVNRTTGVARHTTSQDHVSPYFADALDRPQVKAYAEVTWTNDWRLWGRFTRAGVPSTLEWKRTATAAGEQVYQRFASQEDIALVAENKHPFSDMISLDTTLGFDSEYYSDYLISEPGKSYDQDPYKGIPSGNVVYDFRESELTAGALLHLRLNDRYRMAAGYNFAYEWYRPGDLDQMYMNLKDFKTDGGESIQQLAGDGFDATMHSLIGEANLAFDPRATVLLSGRLDKHEFSDYLFSPRVALSSQLDERNVTKLVWQRSLRMCTTEEAYKEDLNGRTADTETLTGYEFMYSHLLTPECTFNVSVFYDQIEAIGWLVDHSGPVGDLEVAGVEPEVRYQVKDLTVGASYTYTKQLSWECADPGTAQGISYADYDVNGLEGTGNDLNNWANHSTKLFATMALPRRFTLHVDTQIFWAWEGYKDGQEMYEEKHEAEGGNAAWNAASDELDDENFAGTDVRLNAALSCKLPGRTDATLTLFGQNLTGAKRYAYSSGFSGAYPDKTTWIETPAVVGLKADMRF